MLNSRLPTEVELVYEVMPCNSMRTSQEPLGSPHACTYFRKWGTYHSFDYKTDGPPATPGISQPLTYIGRATVLPEVLSGCRKAPILAIGINPNLPGWFSSKRGALNPLFDDYKQYAHYFRYRAVDKLIVPSAEYAALGGGPHDTPFSTFKLEVATDADLPAQLDPQTMYRGYQGLLADVATQMGWPADKLKLGEDLAYMNMVACPSAKWRTQPDPRDPGMPIMTVTERNGIVRECFHERKYFRRQLRQSLPAVVMVFSQNTATAFIAEFQDHFAEGNPRPGEQVADLLDRTVRLHYGQLPDGTKLTARVIFSPHISGDPNNFEAHRAKVVGQLVNEAQSGGIQFNPATGHLRRPRGGCVFCPMLEIGRCDYEAELVPLETVTGLLGTAEATDPVREKSVQADLLPETSTRVAYSNWEDPNA